MVAVPKSVIMAVATGVAAVLLQAGCASPAFEDAYPPGSAPHYVRDASAETEGSRRKAASGLLEVGFWVRDEKGKPVAGASIDVWAETGVFDMFRAGMVSTDTEGRASVPVPEGEMVVVLEHEGHAVELRRFPVFGPDGPQLELVVSKGVKITGRLADEEGNPIEEAEVFLLPAVQRRFLRSAAPIPILAFTTGQAHRLYDLNLLRSGLPLRCGAKVDPDGSFTLLAHPSFFPGPGGEGAGCRLYVRAPGRVSRILRIDTEDPRDLDIRLREIGHRLEGRVVGSDGKPMAGCYVFGASGDPDRDKGLALFRTTGPGGEMMAVARPWFTGPTGPDGRFLLPLPEDEDRLRYVACIRPGFVSWLRHDVDARAWKTGTEIPMDRGRVLYGDAVFRGKPVPSFRIVAGIRQRANLLDAWFDMTRGVGDGEGFRLTGMGLEDVYVRIDAPGLSPATRVVRQKNHLGGKRIRMVLDEGKLLRGRVVEAGSDRGVAGAEVRVSLLLGAVEFGNPDFEVKRRVRTGASGEFEIPELPPRYHAGRVYVLVDEDMVWRGELRPDTPFLTLPVVIKK